MQMEKFLGQNMDHMFAFSYDPLKQMLVLIVQNLQHHKEIIDKLRTSVGYEEDLMMGADEFYNNLPQKEPQIHMDNSNENGENRMLQDLYEVQSNKTAEVMDNVERLENIDKIKEQRVKRIKSYQPDDHQMIQIQNHLAQKYGQSQNQNEKMKSNNLTHILKDNSGGTKDQSQQQLDQLQQQFNTFSQPPQPKLSFERPNANLHNVSQSQNPNHINTQQNNSLQQNMLNPTPRGSGPGKSGTIPDLLKKIDFIETRLQQQESIIRGLREHSQPDSAKDRQNENEKREMKDKINSLAVRVNYIESYTEFLRQDQDQLSTVLTVSPSKNISMVGDNQQQKDISNANNVTNIKGDEQQSTIQMLQNLMMRTRKDIQERFDNQMKNLETRVQSQLDNLHNWLSYNQQDGGMMNTEGLEGTTERYISPRKDVANMSIINIENNDSIIKENTNSDSKNKVVDSNANTSQITNGQQLGLNNKPKPLQFGAPPVGGGFRMPQKYINEINDLKKKSEKAEENVKDLFERWNINDRILQKINDYYETNLRAISVKSLGEQLKEFDKILEQKANILEVKKLVSAIHECNDKFNWLEERYKQERKDQESIIQNIQLVLKNLNTKQTNNDSRIVQLEKGTEDFMNDIKAKFQANGWMGGMNQGASNELIRMQNDQQEEIQRQNEKKFTDIYSKMKKMTEENQDQMQTLKDSIKSKVGVKALDEVEERMQKIIDKVVSNCNKRFCEKNEVKKMLDQFESQLENVFEIIFQKVDDFEVNEAMIAKKPLGGYSCINCQKQLPNLNGSLADHQINNKLPLRESLQRLPQFNRLVQTLASQNNEGKEDSVMSIGNLRYKKNYKGMFTNMQNSPKRVGDSLQVMDMSQKSDLQYFSNQNSTRLQPKLKPYKPIQQLGQSQSQKRIGNNELSDYLKDQQQESMLKQLTTDTTSSLVNIGQQQQTTIASTEGNNSLPQLGKVMTKQL